MFKVSTLLLRLCSAAQNATRNMQQNVWNWKNNYSICIHAKLLHSYIVLLTVKHTAFYQNINRIFVLCKASVTQLA